MGRLDVERLEPLRRRRGSRVATLEPSRLGSEAEADGPPHPPFGHLLPVGEKGAVDASPSRRRMGRTIALAPTGRAVRPGYATQL